MVQWHCFTWWRDESRSFSLSFFPPSLYLSVSLLPKHDKKKDLIQETNCVYEACHLTWFNPVQWRLGRGVPCARRWEYRTKQKRQASRLCVQSHTKKMTTKHHYKPEACCQAPRAEWPWRTDRVWPGGSWMATFKLRVVISCMEIGEYGWGKDILGWGNCLCESRNLRGHGLCEEVKLSQPGCSTERTRDLGHCFLMSCGCTRGLWVEMYPHLEISMILRHTSHFSCRGAVCVVFPLFRLIQLWPFCYLWLKGNVCIIVGIALEFWP